MSDCWIHYKSNIESFVSFTKLLRRVVSCSLALSVWMLCKRQCVIGSNPDIDELLSTLPGVLPKSRPKFTPKMTFPSNESERNSSQVPTRIFLSSYNITYNFEVSSPIFHIHITTQNWEKLQDFYVYFQTFFHFSYLVLQENAWGRYCIKLGVSGGFRSMMLF